VIRRIRELMATPFARPPGRRGLWARFAPEWCAGLIYLTAAVIVVSSGHRLLTVKHYEFSTAAADVLQVSAGVGYTLFGIVILFLPMIAAASTLAAERSRGTMEALVLTPIEGRRICLGRLLCVAGPWLRLFLWVLPIYIVIAGSQAVGEQVERRDKWASVHSPAMEERPAIDVRDHAGWRWAVGAFIPNVFMGPRTAEVGHRRDSHLCWTPSGAILTAVRFLNDLSIFLFVSAGAYLCSLWFRSLAGALVAAWLLAWGALATVLAADIWGIVAIALMYRFDWLEYAKSDRLRDFYYMIAAPSLMFLRFLLALACVRLAAGKFDAWAWREMKERVP